MLEGKPTTLVDTGPATDDALATLEQQLGIRGVSIADIELVLLTHHHLDHSGLAETVHARSGATIAAHRATAQWGRRHHLQVEAERRFTRTLIAQHGVPDELIADSDSLFARIEAESQPFDADLVLSDGDTVLAGGRRWRTVFRPGHSTTDTLFVDDESDEAFVGDHLLANITTGAELMPTELPGGERRRGLMEYLGNLRKTQVMPLRRCYTGHGPTIEDHRTLIDEHVAFHSDRLDRIQRLVGDGCATAFDIARRLWSEEIAAASPVLVVWEVLGHLDLLVNRGVVKEEVDDRGRHSITRGRLLGLRHRAAEPGSRLSPHAARARALAGQRIVQPPSIAITWPVQ